MLHQQYSKRTLIDFLAFIVSLLRTLLLKLNYISLSFCSTLIHFGPLQLTLVYLVHFSPF